MTKRDLMRLKGGYLCPRCGREFKSDACKHSWNDVIEFNRELEIRKVVQDEVRKIMGTS